ncbi:hypothetical protein SBRY_40561 [Actinacidiphila bryophytorum]|uniref:Uncharacterized protein n=1 Tax=Actinacidiphila bryophytorum TaxID=1436133 RepID=A0A9W4MBS5_9ACTN|nr:hypothetical protein SBRY_40561 [Actinacidiphila bryophytorum]
MDLPRRPEDHQRVERQGRPVRRRRDGHRPGVQLLDPGRRLHRLRLPGDGQRHLGADRLHPQRCRLHRVLTHALLRYDGRPGDSGPAACACGWCGVSVGG